MINEDTTTEVAEFDKNDEIKVMNDSVKEEGKMNVKASIN